MGGLPKHPKSIINTLPSESRYLTNQLMHALQGMSNSQQANYDQHLEDFYAKYQIYLENSYDFHLRTEARIKLNLLLSNFEGSAPANNIDIFVKCTAPFIFLKEKDLPSRPVAPKPPKKPTSLLDSGFGDFDFVRANTLSDVYRQNAPNQPKLEVSATEAKFSIHQLKHKQSTELLPIWFDFGSLDCMQSLTLSYEIHAEEIVTPIAGELHLKMKPNRR